MRKKDPGTAARVVAGPSRRATPPPQRRRPADRRAGPEAGGSQLLPARREEGVEQPLERSLRGNGRRNGPPIEREDRASTAGAGKDANDGTTWNGRRIRGTPPRSSAGRTRGNPAARPVGRRPHAGACRRSGGPSAPTPARGSARLPRTAGCRRRRRPAGTGPRAHRPRRPGPSRRRSARGTRPGAGPAR